MTGRSRVRVWTTGVVALMVLAAASCAPAATNPDGSVPQNGPASGHGMIQDGTEVLQADLFAGQILRFNPDTGVISERYSMNEGLCRPDDLALLPGGDLVATCPTQGLVIRVHRGGTATVLANVGSGVNPIVVDPSGTSVLVGFTYGSDDRLLRIPLDGSPVQVVASGLPALAGFGFGPDGKLYVPTGGLNGSLGAGGVGRIDISTGVLTQLPLSFPFEPGKSGFDFASGVDVSSDGTIFVAQAFNAAAYAVNPTTGVATLVGTSSAGIADNILALTDGRVLLSGFVGGSVTVFTPSGPGYSTSVLAVGI